MIKTASGACFEAQLIGMLSYWPTELCSLSNSEVFVRAPEVDQALSWESVVRASQLLLNCLRWSPQHLGRRMDGRLPSTSVPKVDRRISQDTGMPMVSSSLQRHARLNVAILRGTNGPESAEQFGKQFICHPTMRLNAHSSRRTAARSARHSPINAYGPTDVRPRSRRARMHHTYSVSGSDRSRVDP